MQIWQLIILLKQPVAISETVYSNPTKLTNYLYYQIINGGIIIEQYGLTSPYTLAGPTVTRPVPDP